MKAYGVERTLDTENPDIADIAMYGMKTSTGQIIGKGGDFRGHSKTKTRNIARRRWKRKARAESKKDIRKQLA